MKSQNLKTVLFSLVCALAIGISALAASKVAWDPGAGIKNKKQEDSKKELRAYRSFNKVVAPFKGIKVFNGVTLVYEEVPQFPDKDPYHGSVYVKVRKDMMDDLKIAVNDSILTVTLEHKNSWSSKRDIKWSEDVRVTVQTAGIESIKLSNGSSLEAQGNIELSKDLKIDISNGSAASFKNLSIKDKEIDLEVSNGSAFYANDIEAKVAEFDCETGSSIKVGKLECEYLDSEVSNGSIISVSGRADKANINSKIGSTFFGENFEVKNVEGLSKTGSIIKVKAFDGLLKADDSSTIINVNNK